MSVSRETLEALAERYGLSAAAPGQLARLLEALAAEADPPTTVREPAEALNLHVADSMAGLEVSGLRDASGIADVGSGAGFPGLALAAALPDAGVDLIESTRRKGEVSARLAEAAGIENVRFVWMRVEEWAGTEGREAYDAVTARAVAPLAVLLEYAAPLLRVGGTFVAWKGRREAGEEAAGAAAAELLGMGPGRVRPVVPFEGARDRHLHVFTKRAPTPGRYPRRPGIARKRPLA